jgi:hypothetical protein
LKNYWIIQLLNKNVISCSYALGDDLKKIDGGEIYAEELLNAWKTILKG